MVVRVARPAPPPFDPTRRWRRWALRVGVVLALAAVALAAAYELQPPLPFDRIEQARAALRRARAEVREPNRELTAAVARAGALEVELARAKGAWLTYGKVEPLRALATDVESLALHAAATYREAADQQLGAARRRLAELADRVDELSAVLPAFPSDRAMRRHFLRSRIDLGRARAALGDGDLATAEEAMTSAAYHADALAGRFDDQSARMSDPTWLRRWQRWVDWTFAETAGGGLAVLVEKASGRCFLVRGGRVVATFTAELGRGGLAAKLHSGDGATPEGLYRVAEKRDGRRTKYYRALLLDYPNDDDRRAYDRARREGRIPRGRGIGGLIEIHGEGGKGTNWTDGCVALANRDMDRVFAAVANGTPVTIVGRAQIPGVPQAPAPTRAR